MALKVLIAEDQEELYKYLFRLLNKALREKGLSAENFEFTNVTTVPLVLEALEQDWDIVLMDYYLGTEPGEREGARFRNGADLVAYRRGLEEAEPERKEARIVAFSGSTVCNGHMMEVGATYSFLKTEIAAIAEALEGWHKEKS